MNYNQINSFLSFGYVPQVSTKFLEPIMEDIGYFKSLKKFHSKKSESYLIKQGINLLNNIVKSHLIQYKNIEKHLLPLSGGLDSRLILAVLLNHIESKDIIALTYGVNGALDYEIPKLITSKYKVEHKLNNLEELTIKETDLEFSLKSGATNIELVTAFYNKRWLKELDGNRLLWSGFLGGELAGSHFQQNMLTMNWADSLEYFINANTWVRKDNNMLTDKNFEITTVLPNKSLITDPKLLSYGEQLDFSVRQSSWIFKAVCAENDKNISPFIHPDWIRFMISLPPEYRYNCRLYRNIAYNYNSDLFSIITKTIPGGYIKKPFAVKIKHLRDYFWSARQKIKKNLGCNRHAFVLKRPAAITNNNLNYLDFSEAFKERADFINLAEINLRELDRSGATPWLNASNVLNKHLNGLENYSQELLLLLSLNIHLKKCY